MDCRIFTATLRNLVLSERHSEVWQTGLTWDQAIDQRRQQVQTIMAESWEESLRSRASKGEFPARESPPSL
jgi:hypothetical protein